MGDVGSEPGLPGNPSLQGVGHSVEGSGENGEILVEFLVETALELARCDLASDLGDLAQRAEHSLGDESSEKGSGDGCDGPGEDQDLGERGESVGHICEREDLEVVAEIPC